MLWFVYELKCLQDLDDRFIAKELSKNELQTMETFAPAYFDYISSVATSGVSVHCYYQGGTR